MADGAATRRMGGAAVHRAWRVETGGWSVIVSPAIVAIGGIFVLGGVLAERLASVWPPDEARRRPIGWRTMVIALVSGVTAAAVAYRSHLPWWATGVYLVLLALLLVLTATDLEQRRLPHLVLDPLILLSVLFVPLNPGVDPLMAVIGAAAAVGFLGALAIVVRGGLALGDLYLVTPIGLMLGWPAIFSALFAAAFLSAGASLALLAAGRVGMRSYIPFGPFLVAGAVLVLLLDERLLSVIR